MKLKIYMSAFTRVHCSREIEVPDDTPESEFEQIAERVYDGTDADDFEPDEDYWERGMLDWEKMEE